MRQLVVRRVVSAVVWAGGGGSPLLCVVSGDGVSLAGCRRGGSWMGASAGGGDGGAHRVPPFGE